jgi:hypothetical protein
MHSSIESALAAVEVAVEDTLNDNPELKSQEDTIYWDMVQAIFWDCTAGIGAELCRITGVSVPK